MLLEKLEQTGDPTQIEFKLHDFGFRGVSSVESAALGGAAHLVNFKGTDTIAGLMMLRRYYDADMAGFSIPAAEHSTITSWGRENEAKAMENMLTQFPNGLVAVVSDSYDIYNACSNIWGDELKQKVLSRQGTVIVRPDSGTPEKVVVEVLNLLADKFGFTKNVKGYKLLPPQIRVIQGDGIEYSSTRRILNAMEGAGWSVDNVAFGMGGGLLQKLNRDSQRFAFKCSNITIRGEERGVFKDPITDSGKVSKIGKLKLILRNDGTYATLQQKDNGDDKLVEVFRDGMALSHFKLEDIRARAAYGLSNLLELEGNAIQSVNMLLRQALTNQG